MLAAGAGQPHCRGQQDAGKDMRRRPHQRRNHVGDVELTWRHSQDACEQGNKGAHDRSETRQKYAGDPIFVDEGLAMIDQRRIEIERPAQENVGVIALPQPERQAIAGDRSRSGGDQQEPRVDVGASGKSTDGNDQSRAGNNRADDRYGFRQGQQENGNKSVLGILSDEVDEPR